MVSVRWRYDACYVGEHRCGNGTVMMMVLLMMALMVPALMVVVLR